MKTVAQRGTGALLDAAPEEPLEGIIIVDSQLRILGIDHRTEAVLRAQGAYESASGALRLPSGLQDPLVRFAQTDDSFLQLNLEVGGAEYGCRVFRVQSFNGSGSAATFALHIRKVLSISRSFERVIEMYRLTERESEILKGIAMGLTSKALAKRMNISPNTVNSFLRMIMIKLGVTTRAGMVGIALKDGAARAGAHALAFPRSREFHA
jgi:DNA-binding CsgD family transcriptional regulator